MIAIAESVSITRDQFPGCIAPWLENRRALIDFWDMEEFAARLLQEAVRSLDSVLRIDAVNYEAYQRDGRLDVNEHSNEYNTVTEALSSVIGHLKRCGFSVSAEITNELLIELNNAGKDNSGGHIIFPDLRTRIEEIHRSIKSESKSHLFMYVSPERSKFYRNPTLGWEDVIEKWPEVEYDIKESSICFALDRYASSAFHILQVAEFGVIKVCNLIGVSGDKSGWGCVQRLRRILDKNYKECSVLESQHRNLLSDIVPLMEIVMKSWRHKLDHVDNWLKWRDTDFGPETADEIRTAVRGFMRNLSRELPQENKDSNAKTECGK